MSNSLKVYYEEQQVGVLHPDAKKRLSFDYTPEWLGAAESFPVSKSMPLTKETYTDTAHSFFTNLLPEAGLRDYVCAQLRISPNNDYDLLKKVGGDCAGALRVLPDEESCAFDDACYEPITEFASAEALLSLTQSHTGEVRLSLAGAQYKMPVYLKDCALYLPLKQAPSSHIMKFSNPQYRRVPEDEFLVTTLARRIGINVVDLSLFPFGESKLATISLRYDRTLKEGRLRRLHQEDFCQVMGISGIIKYEQEGGPSLNDCINIIRQYSHDVINDTKSLLSWMVFNVLVGNCDAHGKNLAFLYKQGKTRLAPFYDLVATINYPRVSKNMAMSIGDERNVHNIRKSCWVAQARIMGVSPQMLCDLAADMSDQIISTIEEEFAACHQVNPGFCDRLRVLIVKQCRRIQKLMVPHK